MGGNSSLGQNLAGEPGVSFAQASLKNRKMKEESELKEQELEEIKLTVIKTSISTTLFSAYLAGKDNPNKPFFQWEKDNNIVESLIGMIDEVNSIRFNSDRPTPVVQAKTVEEVLRETFEKHNNDPNSQLGIIEIEIEAMHAYHAQFTPSAKSVEVEDLQSRVLDWLIKCFGIEISKDITERSDRFLEESLELVQSLNYTPDRAHALVDYVFSRDKGEPFQECGGVMVTLAALCSATGLNMAMDGEMEFARINKPEIIEKIRKKQASKPTGSALPQVWQQQKQAETISRLTESLKTIYSLAKPGSAIYDICDKTLNQKQTDK